MQPDANDNLIQDFLAEATELIQQLDGDLVKLEQAAATDAALAQELLNQIFRALHTIKGAASFLGLTAVTTFAHAAEDALNRLRKGEAQVTQTVMDALLRSVDVVRSMLGEVGEGRAVTPGPQELIDQLHAIAEGKGGPAATAEPAPSPAAAPASTAAAVTGSPTTAAGSARALNLPPQKADLVSFMASDLRDSLPQISQCLAQANTPAASRDAGEHLCEIAQAMARTAEFFDLKSLTQLVELLAKAGKKLEDVPAALLPELTVRLAGVAALIGRQADALAQNQELIWTLDTLEERVSALLEGKALDGAVAGKHGGDASKALALDGLAAAAAPAAPAVSEAKAASADAKPAAGEAKAETRAAAEAKTSVGTEQTVRVEVGRLEALLNLVGQLVLNKNRFLGLARKLREHGLPHELKEDLNGAASDLDRLTGELQVGVMRTRMQPLAKLFERYPRVIRDLARSTDKKINLDIQGKETEVDKSVLELLADPLVHILRNSGDHGIEKPQERLAAGKPETGTIRLVAEHQGSHVRVEITDDGRGLNREKIGKKAVEKGLATAEQVAAMPDEEVFRFIFAAGLSTAEKVTDLSGRGVGMDVVRTNINKLNGQINVGSSAGKGTTIEILIPLTVAILPAMLVGVGKQLYSVPLASIVEIVRPDGMTDSVMNRPVMRLRDQVLPLVDMRQRLGESEVKSKTRFAVVIGVGQQRAGLLVDRLIGQQEVVIKPMDDKYTSGGPFSGATILEDGDVSLILDCLQLIRQAQTTARAAA